MAPQEKASVDHTQLKQDHMDLVKEYSMTVCVTVLRFVFVRMKKSIDVAISKRDAFQLKIDMTLLCSCCLCCCHCRCQQLLNHFTWSSTLAVNVAPLACVRMNETVSELWGKMEASQQTCLDNGVDIDEARLCRLQWILPQLSKHCV